MPITTNRVCASDSVDWAQVNQHYGIVSTAKQPLDSWKGKGVLRCSVESKLTGGINSLQGVGAEYGAITPHSQLRFGSVDAEAR